MKGRFRADPYKQKVAHICVRACMCVCIYRHMQSCVYTCMCVCPCIYTCVVVASRPASLLHPYVCLWERKRPLQVMYEVLQVQCMPSLDGVKVLRRLRTPSGSSI